MSERRRAELGDDRSGLSAAVGGTDSGRRPLTAPLVGVVVVNYDGGPLTVRCLESLQALEWPRDRLRVVLVDNASSDGVAADVRRRMPAVSVLSAGTNLGFAAGCNLGIGELAGCDYVALLNNDAVAEPGWLAALVSAF